LRRCLRIATLFPYTTLFRSLALARFCSIFYGEPSKKLNLIGVTGTNGKTSITYLIKSVFEASNKKTGIIGTMGTVIDNKILDNRSEEHTSELQSRENLVCRL